ncbi:MAG: hypothetical protein PHY72_04140 [Candidatus Pacebacteria bacterium]|nr:hypothetical protein [Candidatus Paceibacterota bacterium]
MFKKFIIFFLILIFLAPARLSLATTIFNQETSPIENPNDVPDALTQYNGVEDEAKGFLQKATGEWEKINNWGTEFYSKNIEPRFGKYVNRVVENIKQGWGEEKQEYRKDFFKALGVAWEKIKNFIVR